MSGVTLDTSECIAARWRRQPDLVWSHRHGGELVFLSSLASPVPTAADWRQAGLVLSQIGQQFGYDRIARGRLTNDALLAMSARSLGLTVLTMNTRDFSLVARYRSFDFRVVDANKLRI